MAESERENNRTGSNTDTDLYMDLDIPVNADYETLRTSGSSTPTDPANTTAENQDLSKGNLFQQFLIQQAWMQQQNETIMTQMIRRLSNSEGTSPIRIDSPIMDKKYQFLNETGICPLRL